MNIAVVSVPDKPTSPFAKGGVEVWTANFVIEEAKRGNKIDLYAAHGSIESKNITLIDIIKKPLPEYYQDPYFSAASREVFISRKEQFTSTMYARLLLELDKKKDTYDLIIDSCAYPPFSFSLGLLGVPVLSVGHFPVDFSLHFYLQEFGLSSNVQYVFPSSFQFQLATYIPDQQKHVVHHGISIDPFVFNEKGNETMVWMSRIHRRMNKGAKEAIAIAKQVDKQLHMVSFIEPTSIEYFHEEIESQFDAHIKFEKKDIHDVIDRNAVLGNAKLFLFPLQWDEPFGLVLLEAIACGTPIVSFARGAVPEIVVDGQTGFLVNPSDEDKRGDYIVKTTGIAGLSEAVERLYSLPQKEYQKMRHASRNQVEEKFSISRMVDQYEEIYKNKVNSG